MVLSRTEKRDKKFKVMEQLYEIFGQQKQIIFANFTNVGSSQMQEIRKLLRELGGTLIISKNTLIKKVIQMRVNGIEDQEFQSFKALGGKIPQLKILLPLFKQKVALIFTDTSFFQLKAKIQANKLPTEARVGVVSPIDFVVPAGPTGLDPSQINFFHALNISTKILKGQIEITKEFRVATTGKKIKASQAALLKKLNLKPFEYGMKITNVYDNGSILPKQLLTIDPSQLLTKFQVGVNNLAGLSLSAGYPIEATIPIIMANTFKNLAALSLESGFKIKELEIVSSSKPVEEKKEAVKEQKKVTVEKVPQPPKVEEEEDIGMGGLFD